MPALIDCFFKWTSSYRRKPYNTFSICGVIVAPWDFLALAFSSLLMIEDVCISTEASSWSPFLWYPCDSRVYRGSIGLDILSTSRDVNRVYDLVLITLWTSDKFLAPCSGHLNRQLVQLVYKSPSFPQFLPILHPSYTSKLLTKNSSFHHNSIDKHPTMHDKSTAIANKLQQHQHTSKHYPQQYFHRSFHLIVAESALDLVVAELSRVALQCNRLEIGSFSLPTPQNSMSSCS